MISIRDATVADAERVHAVHVASSSAAYQKHAGGKGLDQWLATRSPAVCAGEIGKWAVVLAEEGDQIVGFAALDTAKANIAAVYVAPERWRQGIGQRLLARLEEIAIAAQLSRVILQAAGPAILFYQRQGYTTPEDPGPNPSWAEMEKCMNSNQTSDRVDASEVSARISAGAVVIDVREPEQFNTAHVPGAINISISELSGRAPAELPDRAQEIICYCNGGSRGPRGAEELRKLGYSNARSIAGGMRAWQALGKDD